MSYAKQGKPLKQEEKNGVTEPQEGEGSLPPTTTFEQDVNTASQRRINLIWEVTQASIAFMVVLACMIVGVYQGFGGETDGFPTILSSALFLVIGFYFSRTNHSAIGGIGPKPQQPYQGR